MGGGAIRIRYPDETWLAVEVWRVGYWKEVCFSDGVSRLECDRRWSGSDIHAERWFSFDANIDR
jgi:hypothetical protein